MNAEEAERIAAGLAPIGSFRHVAELLLDHKAAIHAWGESYTNGFTRDLNLRLLKPLGNRKASELRAKDFLDVAMNLIEGKTSIAGKPAKADHAGAKRALVVAETVMGFAVLKGFAESNPISLMGKLAKVIGPKLTATVHRAAATTPEGIRRVMMLLEQSPSEQTRKLAWVQAQTFQRPRNVSTMQWEHLQLDGEQPQWVIPGALMKRTNDKKTVNSAPHIVPLARQTVELLKAQRALVEGSPFVFPNRSDLDKPMGRDTLNETMRKVGIAEGEHDPHGFRATARSLGEEHAKLDPRHLEAHLAHVKGVDVAGLSTDFTGGMGRTYARATFVEERRVMVQQWADYLDRVCVDNVVPLRVAA